MAGAPGALPAREEDEGMKKRILGLLTALALCLALLPGAAFAEGTGVKIGDTALAVGTAYVADETDGVKVKPDDAAEGTPYLEYSADGTTLTVHGEVVVNKGLTVSGNLTITSEGPSSLKIKYDEGNPTGSLSHINGTLTLDGEVGFEAAGGLTSDSPSEGILAAKSNYSGNIVIRCGSQSVAYDVQNSGSIDIQGLVACSDGRSMTLKSAGSITSTDIWLVYTAAELSGQNVTLTGDPVFDGDSLTIKAKNDVTITGGGALFSGPVTFEDCGSVAIEYTGEGELGDLVGKITSDIPVYVKKGGKQNVYIDGKLWTYGTDDIINSFVVRAPSDPATAYKTGEGWVFFEPPAAEGGTAKVTLDNAQCPKGGIIVPGAASIEVKGLNHIGYVAANVLGTVNVGGGTLNAIVGQVSGGLGEVSHTVYGKTTLPDFLDLTLEKSDAKEITLTIPQGTELTIPSGKELIISDTTCLKNSGALVNNGTVTLTGTAAQGDVAGTIKKLGLTGGGKVTVETTDADGNQVTESYTNSGVRQLTPAGTLNLSVITSDKEEASQGYKWEVVTRKNDAGDDVITSGTLTLKEGFNAAKVTLPGNGANVTVKTEGDSRIDQLEYAGSTDSTAIHLTFEGGKLAVAGLISFSGAPGTSVTVANGAVLEANGGISVGAAAGVSGTIKVNGTLTAREGPSRAAVLTGKISVGPSGKLEVYGETGVSLGGENLGTDVDPRMDFTKAFELAPGGRFTGDCGTYIVAAQKSNGGEHDTDLKPEDAIVIPGGYLPAGLAAGFNESRTELTIPGGGPFNISSDNVPAPPPPSHRHAWAEDWTTSETHHWHVCTASGCPITEDSRKDGYEEHVYDGDRDAECNVCGYVRTVTRPAPPSEPSDDDESPSSSVGGDSRPTAAVTVEPAEHGEVTSDRARAAYSAPVTLTVQPEKGYELESLTVTDRQGIYMKLSELGGGKYAFTMPGGPVTVRAVFRALGEKRCPSLAFSDLDVRLWYHEATDFVLEAGLMNGYADGTFRPNGTLSRAMLAQILYNRAGRPAVTGGGTFADVDSGAWYAPAVAWAVEQGVADGYADGTFRPDAGITREQLAVMLWRCAGRPAAGRALDFADADRAGDYAREALSWAVERGVMSGKGGGVLDPKGAATRAQTAQMLKNQGRNP